MKEKHLLDLVGAILTNGILTGKSKPSAKDAAKTFFQVRDELLKEMPDNDRSQLPIYLSQKFPRSGKRN